MTNEVSSMAQSPPALPVQPGGTLAYRPVSLLALASLGLSSLYAAVVTPVTVAAFFKGAPAMLPFWLLLVPAAGAALGLVAQWRIRRAEGTLAGAALARWGLWLGLLFGLGYAAYHVMTGLAIQQQANRFLMEEGEDSGFFPRLLKGRPEDVNRAFLLSVPYGRRVGANADDTPALEGEFNRPTQKGGPGMMTLFRESEGVMAALGAGREGTAVRPLGVRQWSYENQRYRVERDYRITTREMQLDLLVPVVAETDPAGGGRKWYVDWRKVTKLASSHPTPLGEGMQDLRKAAHAYLNGWPVGQRQTAKPAAPRDITDWNIVPVGPDKDHPDEAAKAEVRRKLRAAFEKWPDKGSPITVPEQRMCPWEDVGGRIRLTLNFAVELAVGKDPRPEHLATGKLVVQTRKSVDPLHVAGMTAWEMLTYRVERVGPTRMALMKKMMMSKAAGQPGP
jgi:hypothetical protein